MGTPPDNGQTPRRRSPHHASATPARRLLRTRFSPAPHAPDSEPRSLLPHGSRAIALDDAHWFPVDLDVQSRVFQLQRLTLHTLEHTTFMDTRMAPQPQAEPPELRPVQAVVDAGFEPGPVAWLFHTSFCCSTLLARVLHAPPHQVSLKEPLVLRRLGDMRFEGVPVDAVLEPATRLLARPWHPGGTVLVKPTHAALNIAADLMASRPGSRAVVLTSSLEDFIVSNIKKTGETQRRIPLLVERAFRATTLHTRLPPAAFNPPDILAAAALQWAAQREVCLDLIDTAGPERVRMLDASELLADLTGVSVRVARWLGLPAPEDAIRQRVVAVGHTHAKAVERDYGPERRAAEAELLRANYGPAVDRALEWFERYVRPAMEQRGRR